MAKNAVTRKTASSPYETMRMPSEVFGVAVIRNDPAGYSSWPLFAPRPQAGHETTAS